MLGNDGKLEDDRLFISASHYIYRPYVSIAQGLLYILAV